MATTKIGNGPDQLILQMSEDAWLGDAQFTVSVDGQQIGGVQTVTAAHADYADQAFAVQGTFGAGPHTLTINFLNDAYGGTPLADRNLYLDSIQSGDQVTSTRLPFYWSGTQSVSVQVPPAPVKIGSGPDAIDLFISEDAWQGDAQFTIAVDGVQFGGAQTATALHGAGPDQEFSVLGTFGTDPHIVTVDFLNDAYGGTPASDRNLYVQQIESGGITTVFAAALYAAGPQTFDLYGNYAPIGPVTIGNGPDSVVVQVSQDGGSALFQVGIDGVQQGGIYTATAYHAAGQTQNFTFLGNFGPGPHLVSVNFLNDSYVPGSYPGAIPYDRNLYVDSIASAGLVTRIGAALYTDGWQTFSVSDPAAVVIGSDITGPPSGHALLDGTSGDDSIVAHGAQNTINGQGGNDTIAGGEGGGDTIIIGVAYDGLMALHDTITIAGAGNTVESGDEAIILSGSATGTVLRLGNGNNTVALDGAGSDLRIGVGHNVLSLTGGDAFVDVQFLPPNTPGISPYDFSDAITLSGQHNTVSASIYVNRNWPIGGNVTIDGGDGYGTFDMGVGAGTLHTGGEYNAISFSTYGGTFDITAGSGHDNVSAGGNPGLSPSTIRLAGLGNSVFSSGAMVNIVGGDGGGDFFFSRDATTGAGLTNLVTDGQGNQVTLRGAQATIDPGSGGDIVSLDGGQSSLIFHGSQDMLFVHALQLGANVWANPTSTIADHSSDLQIYIDPVAATLDISQFGAASVIHLLDPAAYASAADAYAALTPDGAGGVTLPLAGGSIHLAAGVSLNAGNFAIG